MYILKTLLFLSTLVTVAGDEPLNRNFFISPLKIPLSLSANFGELRNDHFHSGIDIKTQGITGKEVIATAAGYVYRISISPGGFGKAIYLKHPAGYSTVYAHIDRFIPEIEEYIVSRQYEEKSFMVTLWPPHDKFRFDQGDLIAYSGNSGSSSGPHLHYEIRKSDDEIPLNPLFFEFGIEDTSKPVIEELVVYRAGRNTTIDNQSKNLKLNVSGSDGRYQISNGKEIKINGPAGFGLKSYDLTNGTNNRSSVYTIELRIDSVLVFSYRMDSFSFNESRYINSHIDYEKYVRENDFVERAFILPNDKLSVYGKTINRGIFNFNDNQRHYIELTVGDIFNNKSSLTFFVESVSPSYTEPSDNINAIIMPYSRNNRFISDGIIINIPSGALYDTLYFEYSKSEGTSSTFSDIYHVHNRYTPLHKPYTISIKPDIVPQDKASKLLIVQAVEPKGRIPLQTRMENGYLVAKPISFGTFYIGIDTVPPVINANGLSSGMDLSGRESIRIKIYDDFSGIKSYEPVIDGKWALFEFDQKNNLLTYSFDQKRITRGSKHYLTLKVSDYKDNISLYSCEFYW